MEYNGFDKNFGLQGKTALITGAANGIGVDIALLLAEKGADIVAVYNTTDPKPLEENIRALGRKVLSIRANLGNEEDIRSLAEQAAAFARIDILVNNAGITRLGPAEELSSADWDSVMDVNLKGVFLLCQAIGRHMIRQGGGKIVNIASLAGVDALEEHAAYCASKAGLIMLGKVLALEWSKYGINVNTISPTVILTEMGKKVWSGEKGENMKKKIPAGRFVHCEEVAAAVLFLCSDAAGMVQGGNLLLDGGFSIV